MIKNGTLIKRYHLLYAAYVLGIAGLFSATLLGILAPAFIVVPMVLALLPISIDAIKGLLERKIKSEFFVVIAAIIGLIGKEEHAIMIILLIMLVAKLVEEIVEERTDQAIESLIKLMPTDVTLQDGMQEKTVPLAAVQPGMRLVIKTGSRIPVDGVILDGKASINEASLTGESMPAEKSKTDAVFAGTFVEAGSIVIEVQKIGTETLFGKITKLLEQAGEEKANIVLLADKVVSIFVPALLVFIALVWFVTRDLNLLVTILVFGSPIELTLVTPLVILAGIVAAFRQGILVKGGLALERLAKVDTVIFDKTGTLTMGEPRIVDIQPADASLDTKELIKIAAIVEKRSGHVLARAILQKARDEGIVVPDPETYDSVTGRGVEVTYQGKRYLLGSKHFIEAPEHGNIVIPADGMCAEQEAAHSSFYLGCDGKFCGRICVTDTIKHNAKETIATLRASGIKDVVLLSGDKQKVASIVATTLGIEKAYGEIAPDQKFAMIETLQKSGHHVAMVGDGINDAPALKQANVGIAMGAMGMEPAIEAADIVLMDNDLDKIVFVRKLSQKVLRLIKQNIIFGLGVTHCIGIILAFLRVVSPVQAAFFHALTDLFILVNSARLIRFKPKK